MVNMQLLARLLKAFPGGYLNKYGEFVIDAPRLVHFQLEGCDEKAVIRSMFERLTRPACKSGPKLRERIREGMNAFLGTNLTHGDLLKIYSVLIDCKSPGGALKRFIEKNYDMAEIKAALKEG